MKLAKNFWGMIGRAVVYDDYLAFKIQRLQIYSFYTLKKGLDELFFVVDGHDDRKLQSGCYYNSSGFEKIAWPIVSGQQSATILLLCGGCRLIHEANWKVKEKNLCAFCDLRGEIPIRNSQ